MPKITMPSPPLSTPPNVRAAGTKFGLEGVVAPRTPAAVAAAAAAAAPTATPAGGRSRPTLEGVLADVAGVFLADSSASVGAVSSSAGGGGGVGGSNLVGPDAGEIAVQISEHEGQSSAPSSPPTPLPGPSGSPTDGPLMHMLQQSAGSPTAVLGGTHGRAGRNHRSGGGGGGDDDGGRTQPSLGVSPDAVERSVSDYECDKEAVLATPPSSTVAKAPTLARFSKTAVAMASAAKASRSPHRHWHSPHHSPNHSNRAVFSFKHRKTYMCPVVTLSRKSGQKLGLKFGGALKGVGIEVSSVSSGGQAEETGQILEGDHIAYINNIDVRRSSFAVFRKALLSSFSVDLTVIRTTESSGTD
jgi:hypothetical protein